MFVVVVGNDLVAIVVVGNDLVVIVVVGSALLVIVVGGALFVVVVGGSGYWRPYCTCFLSIHTQDKSNVTRKYANALLQICDGRLATTNAICMHFLQDRVKIAGQVVYDL